MLGDFALCHKEETKEILKRLKGFKHLILGNHDRPKSASYWRRMGFDEASIHPITITHNDRNIILSHFPINTKEFYCISGHVHNSYSHNYGNFNASVEVNDYKPVELDKIERAIKDVYHY